MPGVPSSLLVHQSRGSRLTVTSRCHAVIKLSSVLVTVCRSAAGGHRGAARAGAVERSRAPRGSAGTTQPPAHGEPSWGRASCRKGDAGRYLPACQRRVCAGSAALPEGAVGKSLVPQGNPTPTAAGLWARPRRLLQLLRGAGHAARCCTLPLTSPIAWFQPHNCWGQKDPSRASSTLPPMSMLPTGTPGPQHPTRAPAAPAGVSSGFSPTAPPPSLLRAPASADACNFLAAPYRKVSAGRFQFGRAASATAQKLTAFTLSAGAA